MSSDKCILAKASKNRICVIVSSVILASFLFVKFVKELELTIDVESDKLFR